MIYGQARIHYFRPDRAFGNWGVYSFADTAERTDDFNAGSVRASGEDEFGAYFDVRLKPQARELGFIVHDVATGEKDPGNDMYLDVGRFKEAWVVAGDARVYTSAPAPDEVLGAGLTKPRAFWVDRATVAIPVSALHVNWSYALARSADAAIRVSKSWRLEGADEESALQLYAPGLTPEQRERFPQLASYAVLRVAGELEVKGQIALAARDEQGALQWLSGVQLAGMLDDSRFYGQALGVVFQEDGMALRLWAPTALSVDLLLFAEEAAQEPAAVVAMREESNAWSAHCDRSWTGKYYLFRVRVYVPSLRAVVENAVSDPYSVDLALNGQKSRFTDLQAAESQPARWDAASAPEIGTPSELTIYELHVRDFSASDESVPDVRRGTYLAFTDPSTRGMQHLKALAGAGLKAVHLLPTFHFGSVDEDKSKWKWPGDLATFAPDSDEQQKRVAAVQNEDSYNWGYDPVHYFVPQGSYAVDPRSRVREYREMVLALHQAGLRVIEDLVFNHTFASGQEPFSVLDKIVPGYYHRLDANGNVEGFSCCHDTASEHRMMERLMIDAIVHRAREYKIDGFRFDLMGMHFVSNLERIQEALGALTKEKDGVDGSRIYLYGEGWEMGSVGWGARGKNAGQRNLYGTGIGSFNDRMRDAVRGGNPFSAQRSQGFATGLFTRSSLFTDHTQAPGDQYWMLLGQTDLLKIALAGTLRDFEFTSRTGARVRAGDVLYNGQPAGYTASPQEIINYCSVHDNRTLYDAIQMKSAEDEPLEERVRRQTVALSLVAFAQGIPLFHAGDDLLRSKDMDENSFNSGDWFNRIDFSYQSNHWGIGLPPAKDNERDWAVMRELLAKRALSVTPEQIAHTRDAFRELLAIRQSSELFRLRTLEEVQSNLGFLNSGANQIPGLIVMQLQDAKERLLVLFNAQPQPVSFTDGSLRGLALQLHSIQARSSDDLVRTSSYQAQTGTFTVPKLTTAVFVG